MITIQDVRRIRNDEAEAAKSLRKIRINIRARELMAKDQFMLWCDAVKQARRTVLA